MLNIALVGHLWCVFDGSNCVEAFVRRADAIRYVRLNG